MNIESLTKILHKKLRSVQYTSGNINFRSNGDFELISNDSIVFSFGSDYKRSTNLELKSNFESCAVNQFDFEFKKIQEGYYITGINAETYPSGIGAGFGIVNRIDLVENTDADGLYLFCMIFLFNDHKILTIEKYDSNLEYLHVQYRDDVDLIELKKNFLMSNNISACEWVSIE